MDQHLHFGERGWTCPDCGWVCGDRELHNIARREANRMRSAAWTAWTVADDTTLNTRIYRDDIRAFVPNPR